MMVRISLASITTGFVFVVVAMLLRYWYILQRMGYRKDVAVGVNAIFAHHPFLYVIPIFLAGLYAGGRLFK